MGICNSQARIQWITFKVQAQGKHFVSIAAPLIFYYYLFMLFQGLLSHLTS